MATDSLAELLEQLKSLHANCLHDEKNFSSSAQELKMLTTWINLQDLKPLRPYRKSMRELRESIPLGTDWHEVTGFNKENAERPRNDSLSSLSVDVANADVLRSKQSPNVSVAGKGRSMIQGHGSPNMESNASVTLPQNSTLHSGADESLSTIAESTIRADVSVSETFSKLLEEQKKIQAQLQQDMKTQETQFRQQLGKLAEQQRRLIERDTLKDIIQQQQQILTQQMLNASNGMVMQPNTPNPFANHLAVNQTTPLVSPFTPQPTLGSSLNASSFGFAMNQQPATTLPYNPASGMPVPSLMNPGLLPMSTLSSSAAVPSMNTSPMFPFLPNPVSFQTSAQGPLSSNSYQGMANEYRNAGEVTERSSSAWKGGSGEHNQKSARHSQEVSSTGPGPSSKTTILEHLQAMQAFSDSSDGEDSHVRASQSQNVSSSSIAHLSHRNSQMYNDWKPILVDPENAWRWNIVVAVMKGWMVRRLMRTEKVQGLVTTIKDARDFLADLRYTEEEFPGMTDARDAQLQQRIISQLRAAMFELHHLFFDTPLRSKLELIAASRRHQLNKRLQGNSSTMSSHHSCHDSHGNISTATLKARERRMKPQSSQDSHTPSREKRTPKRVDCGLRDGVLPKKEPPHPVKLDPRKFYSKHGRHRPTSAGGRKTRSPSREEDRSSASGGHSSRRA